MMKSIIIILLFIFSTFNAQDIVTDSPRPIIGPIIDPPVDPIICPPNELPVPSGSFCPDGCSDDELVKCPIDLNPFPRQRCTCIFGYRRNSDGICIPKDECNIGCEGDPNAEPTLCGSSCPLTCENNGDPPQACIDVCSKSPCECKPGYVLDSNGRCILPVECPNSPRCPENQTFDWCPRSCPPELTCNSTGLLIDCPKIDILPTFCRPRCVCKDGYIRKTPGGDCILPNDCCDDPNAEMVECVNPCSGGTCDRPEFELCQFLVCIRGCQCKRGYVKNSLGKCVLPTSCRCGRNEIWNPFPNWCERERTCNSILQRIQPLPICPILPIAPIAPIIPRGRCECAPGFVRINGTCLPEDLCCKLNDPNSVIAECPTTCDCTCWICPNPECRVPCRDKGCICRPGYVRNFDGKCIHPRFCRFPILPPLEDV